MAQCKNGNVENQKKTSEKVASEVVVHTTNSLALCVLTNDVSSFLLRFFGVVEGQTRPFEALDSTISLRLLLGVFVPENMAKTGGHLLRDWSVLH